MELRAADRRQIVNVEKSEKNIVGVLELGEGAECRGAYVIRMRLGHLTVKPGYDRISYFMFFSKQFSEPSPSPQLTPNKIMLPCYTR